MSSVERTQPAPLRLDQDSIRLLVALHRGHHVHLTDEPTLAWQIKPRMVVPVELDPFSGVELVDYDPFEFVDAKVVGAMRPLDQWPAEAETIDLAVGIRLIRQGLARRMGYALDVTHAGRLITVPRTVDWPKVTEMHPRPPVEGTPPEFIIVDEPIPVSEMQAIPCEQRIIVSALDDGFERLITIKAVAGDRSVIAHLTVPEAKVLRGVRLPVDEDGKTVVDISPTVRVERRGRKPTTLELDIIQDFERKQDFDRTIISLPNAMAAVLRHALDMAIAERRTTDIRASVAYASFDAVTS
ncbi:MAG: hypothetical protein KYX69_11800 [Sphingomonas sp.]|uniref:hypothetical protein n=1 Tax=Sphingomonas sp. TaxID=28214 RepID=UPI00262530A6|nr:hypothetical protein [Sphingomonas sp.]MDK2768390.1 hypothetical protein [Sphingomonas sp.]